jgi:hypothetical protein
MPSTYSPSLKIELIGNGEQSGTWGQTTNNNMGTLIEQSIAGVESITLTGNKTLTSFNGLSDEARNAVLVFNGSLVAPANVTAPATQKTYIITNNAGANVTIKTASGNGVVIGNGLSSLIYCDGTDFYTAVNVNNVIGNLSVSGNVTVSGGVIGVGNSNVSTTSGNLTLTSNSSIIDMSTNTGAFIPPTGTTGERPSNLALGMSRWNTSIGAYEVWTGTAWQIVASSTYNVSALIVGGGGGGLSGGGGAGGVLSTASFVVTPTTAYTITVGAGGSPNTSGANSTALGFNALGGGFGGESGQSGSNGGSGGGSGWGNGLSGGSGTSGQGNSGGVGTGGNGFASVPAGGGGGAGGSGTNATTDNSGNGGAGVASSITGTSLSYGGGGGGGNFTGSGGGSVGSGGAGGGGNGANSTGVAGGANTGGGGGGSNRGSVGGPSGPGGAGGSGVAIISYINPTQRATGGAVTNYTAGGNTYWVHTFTTSGTFTA